MSTTIKNDDDLSMVSILIPVYNAGEYLRRCLDSITGQTYSNLQIVIIDDGSTDNSWIIMQEYSAADDRIEIYRQENKGVSTTRNLLLEKIKGDFLLFIDSDDWIEPQTVEMLIQKQQTENPDVVVYQIYGSKVDHEGSFTRDEIIKLFVEHRVFHGSLCNKLIRRSLVNGLHFDETVSYGEDALMVWQVLQCVNRVVVINEHLYHLGQNKNSLTRQRFDGRKCSAFTVWRTISSDCENYWPQYSELAHARFACEMTKVLRDAVLDKYKSNDQITRLQQVVRKDGHLIRKTGVSSSKMRSFAWLVSHHYKLTSFLSRYISFY